MNEANKQGIVVVAIFGGIYLLSGGLIWICEKAYRNIEDIKQIVERLPRQTLELKVENVMGGEKPERFYEVGEKKVYLEIDGVPVDRYFSDKNFSENYCGKIKKESRKIR